MRLYEQMMTPCVRIECVRTDDGEGGYKTEWKEGEAFQAVIVRDTSNTAKIAEKEGVTSVYTVTTGKEISLAFHDVIKRLSDGRIFRVTSDKGDKTSPECSRINISQVSAEKWEVTHDEGSGTE